MPRIATPATAPISWELMAPVSTPAPKGPFCKTPSARLAQFTAPTAPAHPTAVVAPSEASFTNPYATKHVLPKPI